MNWSFVVLPVTGAFIGFLTNWVAIQFLFRPRKKFFGVQGIVPKRKEVIAGKLAEASLQFLPSKIENLTKIPYIGRKILDYIEKEVSNKAREMDDSRFEKIIRKIARREFLFIEVSGAVLGFVIGIVQAAIIGFF